MSSNLKNRIRIVSDYQDLPTSFQGLNKQQSTEPWVRNREAMDIEYVTYSEFTNFKGVKV
jgi:hypothetical protein